MPTTADSGEPDVGGLSRQVAAGLSCAVLFGVAASPATTPGLDSRHRNSLYLGAQSLRTQNPAMAPLSRSTTLVNSASLSIG